MEIDIVKRSAQAKEFEEDLLVAKWSMDRSTQELLFLAKIIRDNSSKEKRWSAFEKSDLYKKTKETRSLFNSVLEPRIRMYVKASGKTELHGDLVRWSLCLSGETYSNLREFDQLIEEYIESIGNPPADTTDMYVASSSSTYSPEFVGSIIGYGAFFLIFGFMAFFLYSILNPDPVEVAIEKQRQEKARQTSLEACIENTSAQITRSCQEDPVFSYCSLNFEENKIIGSGCTRVIKGQGGYTAKVKFCVTESLKQVKTQCLTKIYGCVAVTGDINYKP